MVREIVVLQRYTNRWRLLYLKEQLLLRISLRKRILSIQHVGSTSIQGMISKPIIDILLAVKNYEQAFSCLGPTERLGYEYQGENSTLRQYFFTKGLTVEVHLLVVEIEGRIWGDRILFRDYLCRNPEVAHQYAELKRELVRLYSTDLDSYQSRKLPFVRQTINAANLSDLQSKVAREDQN